MDYNLNIAISIGGSLGDVLNTSALAVGLKREFPQSSITMFVFKGAEILRGNKTINTIKIFNFNAFNQEIKKEQKNYDIFCEVRYPVKYFFSDRALKIPEVLEFKEFWESNYKLHYEKMWEEFLGNIPRLNDFCSRNLMTVYDLRRDSSNLNYTDDDQFLMISPDDFKASERFKGLRIALVNNSGVAGTMTKSWSLRHWAEVIAHLKKRGMYIIQVGIPTENEIDGVHERFHGTIHETAALMKMSKLNIFIEGGLAHVARAVKKKSIVLFGPTPVQVFGYPENINIRGTECSPCWHPKQSKHDWNKTCIKSGELAAVDTPACMRSLEPTLVIKAIDKMLMEQKVITKKGILHV